MQLSYIAKDLNNTTADTWVPNALALVQAVIAPVVSSASDTFQARKSILVGGSIISFIGAAIAPGSSNIYRLIGAQILIGFGFATVPLAYCVPSEILPKKWSPSKSAAEGRAGLVRDEMLTSPIYSGASGSKRCSSSRRFYRPSDNWRSNQGKPAHRLAQLLCGSVRSSSLITY